MMPLRRGNMDTTASKVRRYAYESQVHYLNPTSSGTTAQNAPPPRDEDYETPHRVFASDADTLRTLREQL